ncbi:MAG: DNA primase, partial [Rhodoluna sp.]
GFDKSAAEQFGIGFAPKGWNGLFDHLTAKGFSIEELVAAGLVTKSERGAYDKFRGRLIWPIRDTTGQVIGFGARKLFDDDQGPKYLNTSDTLVYHKSQVLYGIDLAKKDISKQQRVVVVEGYTDVMACHLAGVTTAVATCGTAFGDDHIRIINRLLSADKDVPAEVIFTFDPDAAGQKAAMRAFADSSKFTAQTFVAVGPDGLDPCDLRSAKGDEAVRAMLEAKKPLFEFAIKQKLSRFDLATIEGRVAAARAAAPIVAGIQDPAMRPAYIRELAGWVNLDGNDVAALVDLAAKAVRKQAVSELRKDRTSENIPVDDRDVPPADSQEFVVEAPINLSDPITRFERQTLEVLVQLPQAYTSEQLTKICSGGMSVTAHNQILRALQASAADQSSPTWLNTIASNTEPKLHQVLREIAANALPAADGDGLARYGQGVISRAIVNVLSREKADLLALLRRVEPGSPESADVQRRLMNLETERRALG